MVKLGKILGRLFRLGLSLLLMLLGLGVLINPAPIPGTSRETSIVIAIILIAIGGALYKIIGIQAETRVKAKAWKEVMEE